ncbi:MAG TPA: sensor domain-containing protein [Gaiellaceae bacterium]|nr:sensor domain-containing protein [Gaiellaceae bacterium]
MTRFLSPLAQRRTYLETFDLLLDLVVGVLWFTVFTTLLTTGASLLITLVGLPILTATFYLARAAAHAERVRVRAFLGTDIPQPAYRPRKSDGLWHRLIAPFADRTTWKEVAYLWLVQPTLSIVNFTVAVTAWAVPLWAITLPIYAVRWHSAAPQLWSGESLDTWQEVVPVAIGGLVVLPLVPWIIRAFASIDRAAARWGLGQSKVAVLRETQARSVDIAMADRRQIERDLHDGAQQRLLALGMELGMALEKFESDPAAARGLVGDAHAEVQRAIAELRNLARGIHPAVLTDRGLDPALSALAARSPVPVRLDVRLDGRPPASVEATAYFIVAEALTNAARYANAKRVDVNVRRRGDKLHIEVKDDGVGGAQERAGGGLAGLADRANSVEGSLRISSPQGGPTVVAADLPCG